MAINKVEFAGNTLIDLTPTTAEASDVAQGKYFMNKSGTLTQGTATNVSDYEDLTNKPSINNVELIGNKTTSDLGIVIPTVPTNLSSFTDDLGTNPTHTHSQYLTSESDPIFSASVAHGITSSDITNWNAKSEFSGSYNDLTNKPNIPDSLSDLTDDSTHRVVTDTEKSNWDAKSNFSGNYNDLTNKPTLFSGDYDDLTNKPTIPDELSDLTDDTTHRLVTDSEKTTWSGKQDALVSGTNIKTINNQSLLGSGNIDISGGGGTPTDVRINGTSITSNNVADIITETAYDSSTNKIATVSDVPTKTSDLTNDSNFISGLVMLTYDSSTWQDFIDAYNSNKIVYCKVGGRMAFLAYVEATRVEFQYYRSLSSPTVSSQPDEVYVYVLTSANKWTTTTRKASSTIDVGTGLSRSYTKSSRTMKLSVDTSTMAQKSDLPTKTSDLTNDSGYITGITSGDVTTALGYYPEAEANIYSISSIRNITSASDSTYLSLKDDVINNKPIKIQGSLTTYDVIGKYSSISGLSIFLWFNDSNNTCTKITLISDGTDVETTIETTGQKNYSTGETIIGTWINGKPLYRKVYKVENSTAFYSLTLPANANVYTKMSIMQLDSDGAFTPNYYWNNTDYLRIFKTSYGIQIRTSKPDNTFTHWIILEYTKSTD